MAHIIPVTSLDEPALAPFVRLTEAQLKSRRQPDRALFIAESPKVIALALDAGLVPRSFLMEERHLTGQGAPLIARCPEVPVYTGSRETLSRLTGYPLTRGILCAFARPAPRTAEQVCAGAARVAVLEGIVDTTNVGAIFRSAAGLHVDAVLLSPTCCDPLNRRAVRVSMGTVFQIPWAFADLSADQWPTRGPALLHRLGFATAAMALTENAKPIDDPAVAALPRLAIFLGTEGDGLAKETIARCDHTLAIPMSHGVDSLNVAAASAVAFWQLRLTTPPKEAPVYEPDPA